MHTSNVACMLSPTCALSYKPITTNIHLHTCPRISPIFTHFTPTTHKYKLYNAYNQLFINLYACMYICIIFVYIYTSTYLYSERFP